MKELPYEFDLLYDIKTWEQLRKVMRGEPDCSDATPMQVYWLLIEYNLPVPVGFSPFTESRRRAEMKLVPCHFCWGEELSLESSRSLRNSSIHCNDCGMILQLQECEEDTADKWNRCLLPLEVQRVLDAAIVWERFPISGTDELRNAVEAIRTEGDKP